MGSKSYIIAGLAVFAAIVLLIGGCSLASSYTAPSAGNVGVCQQGGPLDGTGTCGVMEPGSSREFIGAFNSLRQFPASTRNYIISSNPKVSDSKGVDQFCGPTKDQVIVCVEGQALFELITTKAALVGTAENKNRGFFQRYGVRQYNGKHPYDGEDGWLNFLQVQIRPLIDNALREAIGEYNCAELNSACGLLKTNGEVKAVATGQNLNQVQEKVAEKLSENMKANLGGNFFDNVKFVLQQVNLTEKSQSAVEDANAAKARVQQAKYDAQSKKEAAEGDLLAARKQAQAARTLASAYKANPSQVSLEFAKIVSQGKGTNIWNVGGNSPLNLPVQGK